MSTLAHRIVSLPRALPVPERRERWWQRLAVMLQVWRTRRALLDLDDRALADLGLTRAQMRFEAGRWPWDFDPPG
ncbi:MAG TPA: DUF1127 domain-containing protein [Acetobacteraceae bacterium]|nr:DUF1127 domain-containing protein [Acetobacteraceae bacterium]